MPISLTYVAIAVLTYLGVDNATEVAEALMIVIVALIGLYGRYRASGITWFGWKK